MAGQQARVDRIDRSLKRLGFRLIKTGRSFSIAGNANEHTGAKPPNGGLAEVAGAKMTLAAVEQWIGEHIKPKRA